MPGPIDVNPNVVKPLSSIAYQDNNGNWHAGADSKFDTGSFVSDTYANRARGYRKNTNFVKSIMRGRESDESEAREIGKEIREAMDDAESEEERRDIWKRYTGSP